MLIVTTPAAKVPHPLGKGEYLYSVFCPHHGNEFLFEMENNKILLLSFFRIRLQLG
jgi:hypothetical protein